MKSALLILAKLLHIEAITAQVDTPNKGDNIAKRDRDEFDLELWWENNLSDAKPRF